MNMRKKPPLRCRIGCKMIGKSPSALMWKCGLGRRAASAKCARCPEWYPNKIVQGFAAGVKAMKGHEIHFSLMDEMHEMYEHARRPIMKMEELP